MTKKKTPALPAEALFHDLRGLIEETRAHVATTVNAALTMLYWRVGKRINEEILRGERAAYGAEILPTLSAKLVPLYGDGFSARNLARMIRFSEDFSDERIVATLMRQLSWSHFVEILAVKDGLARDFYAEMCRMENWNVRTLRRKISSMAGKDDERVELLELNTTGIHVAEYLTILPPKELLRQKLHAAIKRSKQRIEKRLQLEGGGEIS